MSDQYDVVIVGGGIVGATLAIALLDSPLQVAIVEKQSPQAAIDLQRIDNRTYAITRASERIFRHLDVWERMQRISPFQQMHVWDGSGNGEIHFDSATLAEPTLGYIIEQAIIQDALQQQLANFSNHYQPDHVTALQQDDEYLTITLDSGKTLQTRLLVSAEGANSSIRQLAGIACDVIDYAQQAVVATVTTSESHQRTAWQRFLPDSILAFLPLVDVQQSSIVWSCPTPKAQHLLSLDDATFCQTVTEAFAQRLGEVMACEDRVAYPLLRRHARDYVRPRIALVGDAAHTVHPLAGQGVNLGLLDVASLVDVILQAQQQKRDIGSLTTLQRYQRQRKGDNHSVQLLMDGFKLLFNNSNPLLMGIRNLGLNLTNATTPLKQQIMLRAMGLQGGLPPLARELM